jgi:hypothetical protein
VRTAVSRGEQRANLWSYLFPPPASPVCSAELTEFFTRSLSSEGYSGCEVRVTHARTEIIIRATHTQEVLGEKGRRIRELTSLVRASCHALECGGWQREHPQVQKRFKFPEGSVELYAEKVQNRGLDAIAQCESLRYKLLGGLAVRRYVAFPAGSCGPTFQIERPDWRLSLPQCLLRCPPIHHGGWC